MPNRFTRRSLLAGTAGAVAARPAAPVQAGGSGRLNLIHIGVDTWGTHWLGCFGNAHVRTPHADALAARSAVFTGLYPEVLPTIPCRRSIYTGRRIFPSRLVRQRDDPVKIRGWHQLYAEDVTFSETLRAAGYTTGFVTDLYHQFKPDKNFHRGFDSWRYIRGQEADRLESGPAKAIDLGRYLHASQADQRNGRPGVLQYLLNRLDWKSEDDWLASQVFRESARWLDRNLDNQPFYLHLESFSPHEFWDPPEDYYRLYAPAGYHGPRLISPPLTAERMSPQEVAHVRALYGGYVTFVDTRMGKFLEHLEALGLMSNSVIVFVADHGTMMGEQGQIHKGETRIREQVTHVPLFVYHPRQRWEGRKIGGFVQHTDILPTVLDILGVDAPSRTTGESLLPLIEQRRDSSREVTITGWGEHGSVRTHEWDYIGRWSPGKPFEELYDLRRDPDELTNVADQHPAVVKEYRARLKEHVDSGWEITKGTFAEILA